MKKTGWLLDCNVDREKQALTLWIKCEGKTKGYTYRGFHPSVYVSTNLMRSMDWSENDILRAVREHPKVVDTEGNCTFRKLFLASNGELHRHSFHDIFISIWMINTHANLHMDSYLFYNGYEI